MRIEKLGQLSITYLLLGAGSLLAGCPDSGSDRPCVGHGCPTLAPYGGEVMMEYVKLPDGQDETRIIAFFVDSTTADHPPLPARGTDVLPSCTNYRQTPNIWPAQGTLPELVGEHTVDVGETITLRSGDLSYTLTRQNNTADPDARVHETWYFIDQVGTAPPAAYWGAEWSAEFTGDNGQLYRAPLSGNAIYTPPAFQYVEPTYPGMISVNRGADWEVRWEVNTVPDDVAAGGVDSIVVFIEPMDLDGDGVIGLHTLCIAPNTGYMKVPAAVLAGVPDSGIFIIGNVAHHMVLSDDDRLMHLVGRACYLQPYTAI